MQTRAHSFIIDLFDEPAIVIEPTKPAAAHAPAGNVDLELRLRELERGNSALEQAKKALNEENAERRRVNKELSDKVEGQKKQFDAIANRTKLAEARAALADRGVIHKDVVNLFLSVAGDKIKVDDSFDVTGIDDALDAFSKSHSVFFKHVETAEEKTAREAAEAEQAKAAAKKAEAEAEAARQNKTGKGSSLPGDGAAGNTGLKRDPNDKRTAAQMLADTARTVR